MEQFLHDRHESMSMSPFGSILGSGRTSGANSRSASSDLDCSSIYYLLCLWRVFWKALNIFSKLKFRFPISWLSPLFPRMSTTGNLQPTHCQWRRNSATTGIESEETAVEVRARAATSRGLHGAQYSTIMCWFGPRVECLGCVCYLTQICISIILCDT